MPGARTNIQPAQLVPDDLWALVTPLLPPHPPHRKGGRPWRSERRALGGIMFVPKTGRGRDMLPRGPGSGGRVAARSAHASARPARPTGRGCRSIARACAPQGGGAAGPNPTARGKPGTKRQLAVKRRGLPPSAGLTGATVFAAVVARIPPVRGSRGRPGEVRADKGDAARHCRRHPRRRGIRVRIAREGAEDKSRSGRWRRVAGRTFARSNHSRRLAIRDERREGPHQALLDRARALISLKALRRQATGLGNE